MQCISEGTAVQPPGTVLEVESAIVGCRASNFGPTLPQAKGMHLFQRTASVLRVSLDYLNTFWRSDAARRVFYIVGRGDTRGEGCSIVQTSCWFGEYLVMCHAVKVEAQTVGCRNVHALHSPAPYLFD